MAIIVNSGSTVTITPSGGLTLTADSTIAFNGSVLGSGLITGPFTLVNQGVIQSGFGLLDIDTAALVNQGTIEAKGSLVLPSTVSGSGSLLLDQNASLQLRASDSISQNFINNGVVLSPSTSIGGIATIAGQSRGTGIFGISPQSTGAPVSGFEVAGTFASDVNFGLNPGELILDSPSLFTGAINEFFNNETIILNGLVGDSASLVPATTSAGSFLTISNGGGSLAQLHLVPLLAVRIQEIYSQGNFTITPDTIHNSTTITTSGITMTCFRAGTRIRTRNGEVAIEHLALGDSIPTHFAGEQRVRWIGHRTIDCRRHPNPHLVHPIRVAAGAFGPGRPGRDLFLSRDHALLVDGVLIPVRLLINDETIVPDAVESVTYYHIELEYHDILMAEGLAAESYLDAGDRASFANGGGVVSLFPDFAARSWEMRGCAPLVLTGPELAEARMMLAEHARRNRVAKRPVAANRASRRSAGAG